MAEKLPLLIKTKLPKGGLIGMQTIYSHECKECGHNTFDYYEDLHHCNTEYRWVCNNCGVQMKLKFSNDGKTLDQEPTGKRCERTKVLLKVPDIPLAFIVDGVTWGEGSKYFYEEHTCPSNVMRSCDEVIYKGDEDPHGMLELIEEILITGPSKRNEDEVCEELMTKAINITDVIQNDCIDTENGGLEAETVDVEA